MKRSDVKKAIEIYSKYPFYAKARTVHKSHRDIKLDLGKGSFLYDIYRDNSKDMVVKKATQCGISEYLIVRCISLVEKGKRVFYVFPNYELKNQFVKERFNKSIAYSPYYKMLRHNVEKVFVESLSLIQLCNGVVAFVGSYSPSAFLSFAADDVIVDELDNCNMDNIQMASERQAASVDKSTIYVGNPTILNFGIDHEYSKTDMKEWFIKCEHCGEWFKPDFFDTVVLQVDKNNWVFRDKKYKGEGEPKPIHSCGRAYNRYSKGEWVGQVKSYRSGYHISKMFSTQVTLMDMIRRFQDGIVNDTIMQRFYNGDLGLAFTSKGAKITQEMLDDCISDYMMPDSSDIPCIAGVDIGNVNNVVIATFTEPMRIVYIGVAKDILDILSLFKQYKVRCFVVDAMPERREATKLCARWKYGLMNFYIAGKRDILVDQKSLTVSSNRTMALDAVKEKILMKDVRFPVDVKNVKGFYDQMQASTRVFDEKREEYNWEHGSEPDHYHHAFAYMLIARRVMAMIK